MDKTGFAAMASLIRGTGNQGTIHCLDGIEVELDTAQGGGLDVLGDCEGVHRGVPP